MKCTVYLNKNTPGASHRPTFVEDLDHDLVQECFDCSDIDECKIKAFLVLFPQYKDIKEFCDCENYILDDGMIDDEPISKFCNDWIENADWDAGKPFVYKVEVDGKPIIKIADTEDFYSCAEDCCDNCYEEDEDAEFLAADKSWETHIDEALTPEEVKELEELEKSEAEFTVDEDEEEGE